MPNIYDLAAQFRADLIAAERDSANVMVKAYAQVYIRIQAEAKALLEEIEAVRLKGNNPYDLLVAKRRLDDLRPQILDAVHAFARFADAQIANQQRQAVYQAGGQARQLTLAGLEVSAPGTVALAWNALPQAAVENMVGVLQDGSPLRDLLATLGVQVADGIGQALTAGVATGKSPALIADDIRAAAGAGLTRALTISRTETLRAFRSASIQSYAENDDVVKEWEWCCSFSARTCAVCLAMDGKRFPLDTPFASHQNCRCTPLPCTKSWAEMGLDVDEPEEAPRETGAEWFARQPVGVQKNVLGPGKWKLWKAGKITLDDLVDLQDDPRWGPSRTEKPLRELTP